MAWEVAHLAGPTIAFELGDGMEAAALLAEALRDALMHQLGHLEMVIAHLVPLVVMTQTVQFSVASIDLRTREANCTDHGCRYEEAGQIWCAHQLPARQTASQTGWDTSVGVCNIQLETTPVEVADVYC